MKVPQDLYGNQIMTSGSLRFTTSDTNKAYVADILSTMSRELATSSGYVPTSYMNGNTLHAAVEQSFIELQSVQSNGNHPVQSGFVPPVVSSADNSIVHSDDFSSDGSDWEMNPSIQQAKKDSFQYSAVTSTRASPGRKRRHYDEDVSPEEEEKRRVRRERNKVAAAKCRQRRVDHTNVLVGETEELESEQHSLEDEIQQLQQQKDQLEFLLQAHQPLCAIDSGSGLKIKHEYPAVTTSGEVLLSSTRPSSLPLNLKKSKLLSDSDTLTTPSSVAYTFGLDNLIGSTGLTPISTGLTPVSSGLTPFLTCTGLTPITGGPCGSEAHLISSGNTNTDSVDSSPTHLVSL